MSWAPTPEPGRDPRFAELDDIIAAGAGDRAGHAIPTHTLPPEPVRHRKPPTRSLDPWEKRRARYLRYNGRDEELRAEGLA